MKLTTGLEKVVYSSVTKAVAAAPADSAAPADKEKRGYLSTEANSSSRLYRSALSLNNVDRNRVGRRDDKFLRGSTTSLVNATREVPIVLTPEVSSRRAPEVESRHAAEVESRHRDESPVRPPRKVKTEKEISKKDLFFDFGATPTPPPTTTTPTSTNRFQYNRTYFSSSPLKRK